MCCLFFELIGFLAKDDGSVSLDSGGGFFNPVYGDDVEVVFDLCVDLVVEGGTLRYCWGWDDESGD